VKSYRFDQIFNYVIKIDFFCKNFQKKSTNSEENMTSILSTQLQAKINAHVSNIENVLNRNSKMFENMLTTINLIDNITKTIDNITKTIDRVEEILEKLNGSINRMDEKFQNVNEIRSEEQDFNTNDFEEFPGDEVEEDQPNVTIQIPSLNYQCNIDGCFKKFQNETKLKIHMRRCGVEKKFKCHIEGCCKAFKTKSELEIHFDSHSNEKKYSCDLCESKYKQKSSLSTHKKTHRGQSTSISIRIGSL